MKTIENTVTATDNTIDLADLARVTGGQAPQTQCKDGGCIPFPFPRPNPSPFPGPRNPFPGPRNPFPGPRGPLDPLVGRAGTAAGGE